MKDPTYYVAVFGNPQPPEKDVVESGRYHLGIRGTDIPGERGDVMLLYCTGGYREHFMSAPRLGIILTKDKDSVYYRYLPLAAPISKDQIDLTFTDEDKRKFSNIRFSTFWMFPVTAESFRNCLGETPVKWP
jgi:hypothetical protein